MTFSNSTGVKIAWTMVLALVILLPGQLSAQENVLYIVPGPHQDLGYYHSYRDSMNDYATQLRRQIELIETNPDISFSMGNTYNTKDFVKRYPQYKERLERLMAAGKITSPPQWVGGETGWYSGEFLVRTVAYAKYWLMSQLGHEPHWFQFNDTPSLTPQLAQILAKSGVHLLQGNVPASLSYILGEGRPWYYVGLDGSKVIIYAVDYGDTVNFSDGFNGWDAESRHWARQWAKRFGDFKVQMSLAITDRGTGAARSKRLKKYCREWNTRFAKQYGFRVVIKTEEDFARYLKKEAIEKGVSLRKITGTIDPWAWAGTAWSFYGMYHHALVENLLPTVEKLASINELLGSAPYPVQQINRAWDGILWYADHNWGSNSDVGSVKTESTKTAYDLTARLLQSNLKKLADNINYKRKGLPLMVFNPLNWQRTESVSLALKAAPRGKWSVVDARGKAVPAQVLLPEKEKDRPRLLFQAKDVPALGYKSFYLVERLANSPKVESDLATGVDFIENSFYKVTVAPDGSVKSIYDKQAKRELVDDSKEHKFGGMNAYSGFNIVSKVVPTSLKFIERGPARVSLQVKGQVGEQKLPVTMTLRLNAYSPWVEHEIHLDTTLKGKRYSFYYPAPFKGLPNKIQVGIPYGSVPNIPALDRKQDISFSRRSPGSGFVLGKGRDKDIQKWMSVGDNSYSADLAFDNVQGRTFFKKGTFSATHLVGWLPGGVLSWRFRIRGHKGDWREGDTPRFGWEASNHLLAVLAQRGGGRLPDELSFVTLSTPENPKANNVILSTFKKAFDGKGYVIRFYEAEDEDSLVSLRVNPALNIPRAEVSRTNLLEQPIEVLTSKDKGYLLPILGYGIESVGFFPKVLTDIINPAVVSDLKAAQSTSTTVRLSWTASGDDKRVGAADRYRLRSSLRAIDDSNWKKAEEVKIELRPQPAGKREEFVVKGLIPGSKYYFALKVIDESDNSSPLSNSVFVQTESLDTIAPAAVSNLRTAKTAATSVTLRWTASGDDANKGQAAEYLLGYASQPINEDNWPVAKLLAQPPLPRPAGGKETAKVSGLSPGKQYYFALRVMDEAGNISPLSNLVGQTTAKLKIIRLQKGCSDTHVSGVNGEEAIINYGDAGFTRNWAGGVRSVLIKFKLDRIPAGAEIFKAVLKLYAYDITYGDAGTVLAYRLTQDWEEEETTWTQTGSKRRWKQKGGTIDRTTDYGHGPNGLVSKAPVVDGGAWVELEVTRLVQDWLKGKTPNYGFSIKGNCREDCGIYYRSAEFSGDEKLRPVLEVSY